MAMHYQIFVKGLDGTTRCLQTPSPRLEIKTLKEKLSDLLKIPPELQRLVSGTRQIDDEGFICAESDGFFPQLNVVVRVRGGKGGFGSLLRGAATKAGQKKTNNNDACRDMSGRRLRHVNAEKKLEEWKAEAEERQLEKIAEAYLKKEMNRKRRADPKLDEGAKDVEKYRVEASRAMDMVESAVKDGLLEALKLQRNGKRKMEEDVKVSVKRHKLWMLEEEDEEDKDTDEEIEDAKHDEYLMKGNEECGSSHTSNSESASESGIPSPSEIASPGSGSCDEREANVKLQKNEIKPLGENGNCWDGKDTSSEVEKEMPIALISIGRKNIIHANIHHNGEANVEVKTEEPNSFYGANDSGSGEDKASIDINKEVPVASNNVDGQNIISHNMDEIEIMSNMAGQTSQIPDTDRTSSEVNCGSKSVITNASVEIDSVCDSNSNIGEPLNFDTFNTSKDMEVLGLERLKNELQSCGLKCGGSLSERAARLFLLKTTPLEKLPKKHFAKSNDVGK